MKRDASKTLGAVLINGVRIDVTYEIPGLAQDDASIAGGLVWFRSGDRAHFQTGRTFQLETAPDATFQGTIIRTDSKSASVTVDPG
jgi:hypothetical protein